LYRIVTSHSLVTFTNLQTLIQELADPGGGWGPCPKCAKNDKLADCSGCDNAKRRSALGGFASWPHD